MEARSKVAPGEREMTRLLCDLKRFKVKEFQIMAWLTERHLGKEALTDKTIRVQIYARLGRYPVSKQTHVSGKCNKPGKPRVKGGHSPKHGKARNRW